MSDWTTKRWTVGGAMFEAGRGGIARVARMTARTLIEAGAPTELLALVDSAPQEVAGQNSKPLSGNKLCFAARCHAAALPTDVFIYDAVGPARAHPFLPGLRRPYGVWIHGVEVWDNLSSERKRALQGAAFVLVNSHFTLNRFQDLHFPLQNTHVCPLATESNDAPVRTPAPDGPPTALLVGRSDKLNFRKGHKEVIAAWDLVTAQIPDAELLLVGGGDGMDLLHRAVAESPAREKIKILGFVPEQDIAALWARSHVFVQPSWKEGFGLVYIEAMRNSLPVIASIHDAGQEVNIDGETGFNVDLTEREDLAARMIALLSDREMSGRMGSAGFARWQSQFRFSAFQERLSQILDRVIEIGNK